MDWLHGILNLIGLLFWVLWRAGTMPRPKPANHIAGPAPRQGTIFKHSWVYLLALVGLLVLRAVFIINSDLAWTGSRHSHCSMNHLISEATFFHEP